MKEYFNFELLNQFRSALVIIKGIFYECVIFRIKRLKCIKSGFHKSYKNENALDDPRFTCFLCKIASL